MTYCAAKLIFLCLHRFMETTTGHTVDQKCRMSACLARDRVWSMSCAYCSQLIPLLILAEERLQQQLPLVTKLSLESFLQGWRLLQQLPAMLIIKILHLLLLMLYQLDLVSVIQPEVRNRIL